MGKPCLIVTATIALAGCSADRTVSPEPLASGKGLPAPCESLGGTLFCEKAQRLALYWKNGDFELWDTDRGYRIGDVKRLPRPISWCVASLSQRTIISGDELVYAGKDSFVGTVSVWDAKSGERKRSIQVGKPETDPLWTREWSAQWLDESRVLLVRLWREQPQLAASRLQLHIVDTTTGKLIKESDRFEDIGEHVVLSFDRKITVVKDVDHWVVKPYPPAAEEAAGDNRLLRAFPAYAGTSFVDLDTLTLISGWGRLPTFPNGKTYLGQWWCPDGKTVLTAKPSAPFTVTLREMRDGHNLQTFEGHSAIVVDATMTTTGDKVFTASDDRTIRVWDAKTGKSLAVLRGHEAGLTKVVVLSDNKSAVSAAEETVAKVWDLTTGKLKFDLPGHDSVVKDIVVLPEGVVRTVTLDGTVTTWDCSTGKRLAMTPKAPDFPLRFGVCELRKENDILRMHVVKQALPETK
jgi:WD40 repeat protein